MLSDHYLSQQVKPPTYTSRKSCLDYIFSLAQEDIHINQITIMTAIQYLDLCHTQGTPYSSELAVACLAVSYKVHQDNILDTSYQATILGNCLVHKYQQLLLTCNLRPSNFYSYLYLLWPVETCRPLHPEFFHLTYILCQDQTLLNTNPLTCILACCLIQRHYPHKYKPNYLYRLHRFIHLLEDYSSQILTNIKG